MKGTDRNQLMMCSLDCFVEDESIVRVIDAFVNNVDLSEMGFARVKASKEGRPAYETKSLLGLYLYGGRNGIRSSRKLKEACKLNVEVRWLMNGLEPDFRTISDFRKDNIDCMKKVFKAFNKKLSTILSQGFKSVDGSKFLANNSKDNNFTANKLDDRIEWLNQHSEEYLRQLEEMDRLDEGEEFVGQFTKEELEQKLERTLDRAKQYEAYRQHMEENNLSQLSLTDPDAKLMKSKNGYVVGYNVQTVVDSETHLIDDFAATNHVTDHGLLHTTLQAENPEGKIVEVTADNGYHVAEDILKCLEDGIIPHISLPDGQSTFRLETVHEDVYVTEDEKNSTKAESLKKCLRAGVVPTCYDEIIDEVEIIEKRQLVREEDDTTPYVTTEEMKERAAEGYFIRDPERNIVYCPAGATLRQKSVKKNGSTRYANKFACRRCRYRDKCFNGKTEWKEIDFHKDCLEKASKNWQTAAGRDAYTTQKPPRGHYETVKLVKITFRPDRTKISERKCISEHPFGTIKRTLNSGYFLLRGLQKVSGEFALACFGYNLAVARNLLGYEKLMEAMAV